MAVLTASLLLDVTPILFVVVSALLGIAITMLSARKTSGAHADDAQEGGASK